MMTKHSDWVHSWRLSGRQCRDGRFEVKTVEDSVLYGGRGRETGVSGFFTAETRMARARS